MIKMKGTISCSISIPHRTISLMTRNESKKILEILQNEGYFAKILNEENIKSNFENKNDEEENKENIKPKYLEKQQEIIKKKENLNRALLISNQGNFHNHHKIRG
jgi:ribosomal protein S8